MIVNATITSIQRRSGASAAGKIVFAAATTLSVRCFLSAVTAQQRRGLEGTLKDATAKLRVLKSDWGETIERPADGDRLSVTIDNGSAKTYDALLGEDWEKAGGLANYMIFLREVRA